MDTHHGEKIKPPCYPGNVTKLPIVVPCHGTDQQRMRKIKITRSQLPCDSALPACLEASNYIDSYQSSLIDGGCSIGPADVGKAFFASAPAWIENLLTFRNKIVSFAGLKTGNQIKDKKLILKNFHCAPGDKVGLFTVLQKTEHEVIFGEDDKHLGFRVSFFLSKSVAGVIERQLTISTAVKFNNWFGRLYFLPVKPFHRFIVPAMLKATINQLEQQTNQANSIF